MCNRLPLQHVYATIDEAMLAFKRTDEIENRVNRVRARVKSKPTKGRKRLRRKRYEGDSSSSG
jgi:hypothetical protein